MNMAQALGRLGVRAEDRRKLRLMTPIFLVCGIAEALTYNGFITLFSQRFGSEYLPYLYTGEAFILPLEAWFMSWLAVKLSKPALMKTMYAVMTAILLADTGVLAALKLADLDARWFYPVLFLTSSFVVRQQTVLLWSLAVDVCPTQQAKRLMPLFVSGATLGGAAGGLLTQALSPLGAELVYGLGPLLLIAASFNYRKAIVQYLVPLALKAQATTEEESVSSFDYMKRTFRSPFLLSVMGLMTLMPALYYLAEFLFLNTAHAAYPDEQQFARMFGIVSTLLFLLAFAVQLVSGKLVAWLGASGMLVAISAAYAAAFGFASVLLGSAAAAVMAAAGAYMLTNVLIFYSAEPSYQLFYKTLPMQHRDGYRYAAQGLASFFGILLGAGLQSLHKAAGLGFPVLAAVGAGAALLLTALAWTVRRLYMRELVQGVQTIGLDDRELMESYREFFSNSKAMGAVLTLLRDEQEGVRQIAADIVGRTQDERYLPELLALLADASPGVRTAALRAMKLNAADLQALVRIGAVLEDEEPAVRAEGVRQMAQMKHLSSQAFFFLRVKLLDPHPAVVAEAVKAMYALESESSYEACFEAIERQLGQGGEPAAHVCGVVAELKLARFGESVERLLQDTHPAVRLAATACLGKLGAAHVVPQLLERLPAGDQELLLVTEQALIDMGDRSIQPLLAALSGVHAQAWRVAIGALAALLPEDDIRGRLTDQALRRMGELDKVAGYASAFRAVGREELAELAALRFDGQRQRVLEGVWSLLVRLTDEQVVASIRRALDDPDDETRSSGLEVLAEGAGDRRLAQRLAVVLQTDYASLAQLTVTMEAARLALDHASRSEDDWWPEMAAEAGRERGGQVETQVALGRLGKVIYLKNVPFFADLTLEELGLIAGIATERVFEDGEALLLRGAASDALYVIVDGNVELTSVTAAGLEATLGVLGAGEVCGATSALDESASTVSAHALLGEVRALGLQREALTRLIRLYPDIGLGLLRASLARVRLLEEMLMRIDS
ncbi:HEAT repeat domain-containing protein [Cohnella sp. GCM10020058]|uniref:HEAT repeat domain-containing protein n=1 Tax=Cohnella sp. GCM10020058 TaxID=3317330 RepID=UPI00362FA88F